MSLEQLLQHIPPPPNPVETSGADGWEAIEVSLGTSLPGEYKALIATYGTGGFNEFLYVNSLSPALYDEDVGHPYFLADVQRS